MSATWPRSSVTDQGGYYPISKAVAHRRQQMDWRAVGVGGGLVAYRKSWLQEVGHDKFPDTWDALASRR